MAIGSTARLPERAAARWSTLTASAPQPVGAWTFQDSVTSWPGLTTAGETDRLPVASVRQLSPGGSWSESNAWAAAGRGAVDVPTKTARMAPARTRPRQANAFDDPFICAFICASSSAAGPFPPVNRKA